MKNGFLLSAPYEDADDETTGAGGGGRAGAAGGLWTGAGGGLIGAFVSVNGGDERSDGWLLPSLESTWLFVGVVSCGVIS